MGGAAWAAAAADVTVVVTPSLHVRAASPRDVEEVFAIESASFSDPWSREAFTSSLALPHFRFLVAEELRGATVEVGGGPGAGVAGIAGYVLAMVLGSEGEIADIAVAPARRGTGVGGRLLDEATRALAGAGVRRVFLEVRESNEAARRLYGSRGFAEQGRRRGYYRSPVEDALVLRRDLAEA